MKNIIRRSAYACLVFVLATNSVYAQQDTAAVAKINSTYRATPTKVNALVHTKLDVKFDYAKRQLLGAAWVTLQPYAYATDSLTLDAKGMELKTVALVNGKAVQKLKYTYDQEQIHIQLDKKYLPGQSYTLFIEYIAKPDELKSKGSAAITDAKGLYFINPDSTVAGKPVQIWTQGETEASSVWFPTIDKTNQKTTSEISMTVPSKYVTLSNGKLVTQLKNNNGTRTDTWKMDLPHAPYLFMMAVGDFKIYKDKWKDKEVSYYLEPAYAPFSKDIFGKTPEMMTFFSKILNLDYPWNKYSQVVVRDFVSGAMENTTATLHGDYVQRTPKEILDETYGTAESTIAHELFHHWFGNYVTTESWSNLTVNESFANYSEYLWAEHKYGKDVADEHNFVDMSNYLGSEKEALKKLVRFHYHDKEDVFDLVSYQKGGRILHMMRNFLGDDIFYKGMSLYLKQNAFKTGEAHQLRLAMEEVSGKDLNWFFDQWYFNAGHPKLTIDYSWDEVTKTQKVTIKQTQEGMAFTLPIAIDIYAGGQKQRHQVVVKDAVQSFAFKTAGQPDMVNVDADKILLAEKTDNKSMKEYAFQYANAPLYLDRLEAIDAAAKSQKDPEGVKIMLAALKDKFHGLRLSALQKLDLSHPELAKASLPAIKTMALGDSNSRVQAQAITALAYFNNPADLPLFKKGLEGNSYAVQGASLMAIALQQPQDAMVTAKAFEKNSKKALTEAIVNVYSKFGTEKELPFISEKFSTLGTQEQIQLIPAYMNMLGKVNDINAVKTGVDAVKTIGVKYKSYGANAFVTNFLVQLKQQKQSDQASLAYIDAAIAELK
ncbi:M1 family aminopeptidase [Pedobacter immunditicola]|uniref:M1 family aminopeptidase n=1 Tax=Pedobacter immunditicola TaxID=3133440 RepID=UPI0030AAB9A7